MASSRRRTREYLLQSLYARSELGDMYDRVSFNSAYFENETEKSLEYSYIDALESHILSHEGDLLSIIASVAPKFDLQTMPVIHILILMIALSEILYTEWLDIPESVSVNEAIELTKRFSDDQGRIFVNGALSTFLKKRSELVGKEYTGTFRVFG
jgi:transcription antitermination protein NusB